MIKELRCQVCLQEYDRKHQRKLGVCPFCGTHLAAMLTADDGYIRINWQQLRVLAIYAKRWTAHFDLGKRGNKDAVQALENILHHLTQYRPKDGETLLLPEAQENVPKLTEAAAGAEPLAAQPDGSIPSPYFRKG